MGSSGGGGTTTSTSEATPEVRELQRLAIPQIREMLSLNPLGQYAVSQPRQIAGTNPFYESAFALTPSLASPTPMFETLYGSAPSIFPGQGVPQPLSSGLAPIQAPPSTGSGGAPSTPTTGASIQDLVQQQVQQAIAAQSPPAGGSPAGGGPLTPGMLPSGTPQPPGTFYDAQGLLRLPITGELYTPEAYAYVTS